MSVLREWTAGLIAACFVGCLYRFLMPQKHFSSVLKLALTAFFIGVLVLPVFGSFSWSGLKENTQGITRQSEQGSFLEEALLNASAQRVKEEIAKLLNQKGYRFEGIEVSMYIDEQNRIMINDIRISGVNSEQRQALHDYLKKKLNLEVTIA